MKLLNVLAALAVACLLFAAPAMAQTTTVDAAGIFGVWRPLLIDIVSLLGGALVAWLAVIVKTKLGLDIEAKHREALQTAIENAAGLVINKAGSSASALKLDVGNPLIAEGINYALKAAPDALAYFGLTPAKLREKVFAKVGVVAAPAEPAPVIVAKPGA